MIPYIETPFGNISTFCVCVIIGVLFMLFLVSVSLKKGLDRIAEENYIYPKIVFSGLFGFCSAGVFDALYKIRLNGGFEIVGITFYGGFIGAVAFMYLALRITKHKTQYNTKEWFDIMTCPFIVFHVFGRLGCFLGGCCYGKITHSFLGVHFPDADGGLIHNGAARYPTQLFEIAALLVILYIAIKSKNRFECYVVMYSVARFVIEFYRGDERGEIVGILSPSQIISIILIVVVTVHRLCLKLRKM